MFDKNKKYIVYRDAGSSKFYYTDDNLNKCNLEEVFKFDILWCGWENDNVGRVMRVTDTNELCLMLTNHGSIYIEPNHYFLLERIEEYNLAILGTQKALYMLKAK